jgi:ABC-type polysaccharide/polyol phosphate transport system ATPase subunit
VSEPVIQLEDVHLSFPLVRYTAGGVKEAFLSFVLGRGRKKIEKEFWALKGVSISVDKRDVVGIVGKNGSGKSTLLRVISGIYRPDLGRCSVRGRVQFLDLGSGFREELTGAENVRLSGVILGLSPRQVSDRYEAIVEFAGVGQFIDQPLRTYSSGMRARLGFAVASVIEPDLLLIDEVLAVGDEDFRKKSMARIEEMLGKTTVVVVSHNMAELKRICTRLVWMEKGKVVLDGGVDEVIERYTKR